ncbi:MAG: hypothetical protein GW925_00220 [Candidatus Pacebacteria bacterium]|nr:hypothetical protein [Candidatus Paceibacterota bacterium]
MRSLKKLLSSLLLFTLFLLVPARAQAAIGTHLGAGDPGTQISVMNGVIGNRPGFPVTIMADMGLDQGTLNNLAEAAKNNGLFPIVRINYSCTVASDDAIAMVNRVKAAFGDDVIIAYGNEVNNGSSDNVGCTDWLRYASNYNSVKGLGNIAPSALDWYMGDPAYKAQLFLDTSGLGGAYSAAKIRTANSYGCIGGTSKDCDPGSTDTQSVGVQGTGGSQLYITEFSLSPGGDDPPDTDLNKVLEFISSKAGSMNAAQITPLVRNVCAELQSEGEWLVYVEGELFTWGGTKVDTSCSTITAGSGSGGYDLSDFPEYNINQDQFYLQPISGMLTGERDVDKIRKDLTSSGYEAYCAAENIEIKPKYNTSGLIARYLELHKSNPGAYPVVNIAVDSVASGDMTNATIPIWRDTEGTKYLMSSLEEYFGFKDVYTQDPSYSEINSAPINSLLSQQQRCVQSARVLLATELMCEKLINPGECTLLAQKVPGTGKIIDAVRGDMHELMPTYRDGGISAECRRLYSPETEQTPDIVEFKQDLQNVPLEINRSYRLAFLVISLNMKQPEKSGKFAGKIFNFFTGKTEKGAPRNEVLVIGFKIPDIATNKGGGDDSGSVYWNDPSYLTRNILLRRDQIRELEDVDRPARRRQIQLQAEAAVSQNEGSKIYCYEGSYPDGVGTPACQNELGKAVVDIVNGAAYGCDTKETEPVVQINDYAGLGDPKDPYGKVYLNEWGNTLLLNLFGSGQYADRTHVVDDNYMDPQKAKTADPWYEKIKTIWTIGPDTWSPAESKTTADYYLVYPMGFELEEIENVMMNTFFTSIQKDQIAQSGRILDGFPIEGALMGVAGGTASFDFPDPDKDCGTTIDPDDPLASPIPKVCNEHVSIAIETDNKGIGFLGAKLGFWLRQVQLSLNSVYVGTKDTVTKEFIVTTAATHSYIDSCPTLEHFLLGQCSGGALKNIDDGADGSLDFETCGLKKLGTGYCAPEYLETFFVEAGFENASTEALKASLICQRESGSSPYAFNDRCLEGKSVDYSLGLFQINMLPRCPGAFKDGSGIPDTAPTYDPYKLPCTIVDQERLNECALSKVAIGSFAQPRINSHLPPGATPVEQDTAEQEKIKADNNIRAMVDLRKAWGNWAPWRTATCEIK